MKDKVKKAATSTKNFVSKHRVAIAVVSTATVCLAINQRALREHDKFLKEHGLYDEYYYDEENDTTEE